MTDEKNEGTTVVGLQEIKAALGNGHGPNLWWLDLLRREGILFCLVIGYGYFIAVPDMLAKQRYIEASLEITKRSEETLSEIKANGVKANGTLEALQKFTGVNTDEHKQVLADHKQMTEEHKVAMSERNKMIEMQQKALGNHEKMLTSQTEEMKAQSQILSNQSKILGSLDKGGAGKGTGVN